MNQLITQERAIEIENLIKREYQKQQDIKEKKENKGIFEIEIIKEREITKEEFNSYESCRLSCITNMFNLSNVELVTGLNKDILKAIIKNYDKLKEIYN